MWDFPGEYSKSFIVLFVTQPPSYLLDNLKGYKISSTVNLTHLMYMDDIKLFAPNDNCLQQLVDTVREFSDDIKMSFGFEKYAKLSVSRPVAASPVFTLGDEIGELTY